MLTDSDRWPVVCDYLDEVFGREDDQLATLMDRAVKAGIPSIAVSSSVGRLLKLLAQFAGARTIVEVGTLAGYSGIWLARGLTHTPDRPGTLITLEIEPKHAAFAQREFETAGVADRVEIRLGDALETLPALAAEQGDASTDLVFLDGIKAHYPDYLPHATRMLRPGGLLVADNVLAGGDWWIGGGPSSSRDAVDAFNRAIAVSPAYEAAAIPIREGVLIARRTDAQA